MAIEKSEALILRVIPFRDTSKILTAYTAERGLVSLLAKGVRAARPRFGAALEIFATADLVWYQKDARELQLLSQAMLLEPRLGLSRSLIRYAHGCAVLELLLKALTGQEPPGRLYALSQRTLEVLDTAPEAAVPSVFRAFEIKAISFLGHRPHLHGCVECGRELDGAAAFAPLQGGAVCPACAGGIDGVQVLGAGVLDGLRRLLHSPLADLAASPPSESSVAASARILEAFLSLHVERYEGLRSLRLLATRSWAAGRL